MSSPPQRTPRLRVGVVLSVSAAVVAAGALLGQAAWASGVVPGPPSAVVGDPVVVGRPAASPISGPPATSISPTTTPPTPTESPSPTAGPMIDSTHTELPSTHRGHAEPDADDTAQVVSPDRVHPVDTADDAAATSGGGGSGSEGASEPEVESPGEPEKAETGGESESTESHDN